jgi:hypothetical protein
MFYASEVLSLKNKSTLSVLYYVSTTNNRSRRISKRDIENIDIVSTITAIREPERPFALRLYSFLLRGIVRIYSIKMKNCQAELCSLLNSMVARKTAKRRTKRTKANEDILAAEHDVISNICSSDTEEFNYVNSSLPGGNEIPVDFGEEGPRIEAKRSISKVIIDDETELDRDKMYLTAVFRSNDVLLNVKSVERAFIMDRINGMYKARRRNNSPAFDCSDLPNYSSVERMRNSSLVSFRSNLEEEAENSDEWGFLGLTKVELNFDDIALGSRRSRSLAFYKVLELATAGVIRPEQQHPHGPIVLRPAMN